jgi:hypothetical protein
MGAGSAAARPFEASGETFLLPARARERQKGSFPFREPQNYCPRARGRDRRGDGIRHLKRPFARALEGETMALI